MFWLVGVVMAMVGAGNGLGKRCAYLVGSEVWGWWFWPLLRADEVFGSHDMGSRVVRLLEGRGLGAGDEHNVGFLCWVGIIQGHMRHEECSCCVR